MATVALIPVSEYLATTYRPDRDFLDGVLRIPGTAIAVSLAELFTELDEA